MMNMDAINQELLQVKTLLQLEKDEDHLQYRQSIDGTSLHDRRKMGVCWYPVVLDKSNFDQGERLLLKLRRPIEHKEAHRFQSGKPVSLFCHIESNANQDLSVNAVVNLVNDQEMILTLQVDDLPEWIGDGKLGVQLLFDSNSYIEMERAMRLVIESDNEDVVRIKKVLLGDTSARFNDVFYSDSLLLNSSQNLAVRGVLTAQDVAILHGPPGTGKSTTLVEAIIQTLKSEGQVLVCTPGNVAVDLLVEKIAAANINVVRIGHPARVTESVLNHTLDASVAGHTGFKELKYVKRRAVEARTKAFKYKRNFGEEEREERRALLKEADALRSEAVKLSQFITKDVLDHAQVIACTLVGASHQVLRNRRFRTVFIDEAAQALEPACWIPILKASRVVFAGDHCQLPPTVKSIKAAKGGLETTLFEKVIGRNQADVMLTVQYRMNELIMAFPGRYFYKEQLTASEGVAGHTVFTDDMAVEFVDTAGCGFVELQSDLTPGVSNPEEAALLVRHLMQYVDSIRLRGCDPDSLSWAVISPYKNQTILLNDLLVGSDLLSNLTINTIDSFQGQERDVVYISLVRSNEKGIIGFLSDIRRMNVAMTRARKKLVVIGDSTTLGNFPFYSQFLDYVNEIGAYHSAWEWMA